MAEFVVVKNGLYAKSEIKNQKFKMVHGPRKGKRGMYVTVDGRPLGFKNRKIRILINSEKDIKFVDASVKEPDNSCGKTSIREAKKQESDEQIMEKMRKRFQIIERMTEAVIEGAVKAVIITGPPGVGKSYGVENVISSHLVMNKLKSGIDGNPGHEPKLGIEKVAAASPLGLYQLLWQYRHPGSLLVLDDSDSVLYNEATLNMLKAVTDSGKRRKLSWHTESRVLEESLIANEFVFEGGIIFITNLDFENSRGKIGEHLKAIVSRCHYIDVGIYEKREQFLRCKQIVQDGMLTHYNFPSGVENEIINYIYENQDRLREISLRMVGKIADLAKMSPEKWKMYADETCLRQER